MRLLQVGAAVAAGVLAFALGALIFRIQEADEVWQSPEREVPTMMPAHPSRSLHDQAGLIGKVAVFWIIGLLLVGLLILDALSIVLTTFKLSNTAQAAASIAATTYKNLHDETQGVRRRGGRVCCATT